MFVGKNKLLKEIQIASPNKISTLNQPDFKSPISDHDLKSCPTFEILNFPHEGGTIHNS